MRVALLSRPDSHIYAGGTGGDAAQLGAIREFLVKSGVETAVLEPFPGDLRGYDLAVIMNLTRPFEAYRQALLAVRDGIPYILFPVYWDLESVLPTDPSMGILGRVIKRLAPKSVLRLRRGLGRISGAAAPLRDGSIPWRDAGRLLSESGMISYVLRNAAAICPNSESEKDHLSKAYPSLNLARTFVILNGIDGKEIVLHSKRGSVKDGYVACVGGIGLRKNQLTLVRAARSLPYRFLIVGKPSPGSERYARFVYDNAPENVEFTGALERSAVLDLLRRVKTHCQPSFIETPGLASLEAAALGCSLVVSGTGPVREYFGEKAIYVDPHDVDSVAAGIRRSMESPAPDQKDADYFVNSFNWDAALRPLTEVMKTAIGRS